MLKKIALAAAVAASSSFATYTFFPVGQANSGQVEAGVRYGWTDNTSDMNITLGAEYVIMQNLELSLTDLGYQLWDEWDECDDDCPDSDGIKAMTIGARYQFMPILIAALDVNIPLNSEDAVGPYDPFGLYAAIQYTQEFMPGLAFGSEAGISYKFEDNNRTEGLGLKIQAELDYTIASIGLTPWIGASFDVRLSDVEEGPAEYGSGDSAFRLWIGAGYPINDMFAVKGNFIMKFADEAESMGGDWMGVNAKVVINF